MNKKRNSPHALLDNLMKEWNQINIVMEKTDQNKKKYFVLSMIVTIKKDVSHSIRQSIK